MENAAEALSDLHTEIASKYLKLDKRGMDIYDRKVD